MNRNYYFHQFFSVFFYFDFFFSSLYSWVRRRCTLYLGERQSHFDEKPAKTQANNSQHTISSELLFSLFLASSSSWSSFFAVGVDVVFVFASTMRVFICVWLVYIRLGLWISRRMRARIVFACISTEQHTEPARVSERSRARAECISRREREWNDGKYFVNRKYCLCVIARTFWRYQSVRLSRDAIVPLTLFCLCVRATCECLCAAREPSVLLRQKHVAFYFSRVSPIARISRKTQKSRIWKKIHGAHKLKTVIGAAETFVVWLRRRGCRCFDQHHNTLSLLFLSHRCLTLLSLVMLLLSLLLALPCLWYSHWWCLFLLWSSSKKNCSFLAAPFATIAMRLLLSFVMCVCVPFRLLRCTCDESAYRSPARPFHRWIFCQSESTEQQPNITMSSILTQMRFAQDFSSFSLCLSYLKSAHELMASAFIKCSSTCYTISTLDFLSFRSHQRRSSFAHFDNEK